MKNTKPVQLQPYDSNNQRLEASVHPPDWTNPSPDREYHLVVVGAGTAGLVTAAGAAGLGARVALVERELMGGDCLNVGCVPSKGIIRAARATAAVRGAERFGIHTDAPKIDFSAVMERMRRLRADISPVDSATRFSNLGVDVFLGQGKFTGNSTLAVQQSNGSQRTLKFRKAVIATGARAAAPPIPGLDSVPYLTNENLFSLTELPATLGVIGGGPIGAEMAQVFARLGSKVILFDRGKRLLSREDPDAAAIVQSQLGLDGVQPIFNSQHMRLSRTQQGGIRIQGQQVVSEYDFSVDQLLVAVGRAPNTDGLGLENVNVQFDQQGVLVNDYLQTSNRKIFAAGDICSRLKFTHHADFQARIVIQNALFSLGPFGKRKASGLIVPRAIYTSPELAQVGMTEASANQSGTAIDTYIQHFSDLDRAILDGQTEGFVKIHTRQGTDTIVGATIVAEHAGDMISEITLAMNQKIGLAGIGSTIHPYPTQAEAIRKLGDQFNKTKLTPLSQRILGWLRRWNVGK